VRLQPIIRLGGAVGRWREELGTGTGPVEAFYGDSQVQDEGDLFVGTRMSFDVAERGLTGQKLHDAMQSKRAPALEAREWLNDPPPVSLENHVVLIYFWADWCSASVDKLPQIERLHKKFRDRGLIVVGIHSSERSDSAGKSVKDNHISFPVMIDSSEPTDKSVADIQDFIPAPVKMGMTAERYRVGALPNCFVINKSGKLVWGFGMVAPSDKYIEHLLK
jgi:thiol-disulfide isomerase/thioredoxin